MLKAKALMSLQNGTSGHKAIFVLQVTRAGLPALAADINVELRKLHGDKRRARYQNYALQGPRPLPSTADTNAPPSTKGLVAFPYPS